MFLKSPILRSTNLYVFLVHIHMDLLFKKKSSADRTRFIIYPHPSLNSSAFKVQILFCSHNDFNHEYL